MKRITTHQPDFIPYLGFFDRLLNSDVYVVLDDVQFIRRGWHHRDKIKTRHGEQWLSLSTRKGDYHQLILDVRLQEAKDEWIHRNINLISENYNKARYFDAHFPEIERIYRAGHERLVDINMAFIHHFLDVFNIDVKIVYSSDLGVDGRQTEKLIGLTRATGGTHYLSGTGALDYLDKAMFDEAGIALEIQDFHHPVYPQLHGDFIPQLSSLDCILNCGPNAKDVIRKCRADA